MVDGVSSFPTKKRISWRLKGAETVSVPPVQYYIGMRRKKKAIHEKLEINLSLAEPPWETESRQWSTEMGRGHTWPGRGSYL